MKNKYLGIIIIFLFVASFSLILIYNFFYSRIYSGEPFTKIRVVILDKPNFYYKGIDYPSYYEFTAENYRCAFRISGGALDIIKENKNIGREINSINTNDTVSIDIKSLDTTGLQKEVNVEVVGFTKLDKQILDPEDVASADKELQSATIFYTTSILFVFGFFYFRKQLKQKSSN